MTKPPEDTAQPPITVPCPTCGGPSLYAPGNRYRPFCCARCKQIDLGAWAAEEFRVPSETPAQDDPCGDPNLQP